MTDCLSDNTVAQWLDRRLSREGQARIDGHIDACPRCRALLAGLAGGGAADPWLGQWIGNYRLERRVGSGGMGVVYEALYPGLGRRAAIKLLLPRFTKDRDLMARFVNEGRAVNRVRHPGIVDIYEVGQRSDGAAYLVMEYLDGETLGDRIRSGPIEVARAVGWARQLADALCAAHQLDIIHRDLKPQNVMLVKAPEADHKERVKVLDFGIAKVPFTGSQEANGVDSTDVLVRTEQDVILGTPIYMSPEQCRGAGQVTAKSDVYSLGVMLYQIFAGRPPFIGAGPGDVIAMHLQTAPQPLREINPGLPEELSDLIHDMLTKDPAARPSMAAVLTRLDELAARLNATGSGALHAPGAPDALTSRERRSRSALVLLAVLAGLGVVGWVSWPRRSERVAGKTTIGQASEGRGPATPGLVSPQGLKRAPPQQVTLSPERAPPSMKPAARKRTLVRRMTNDDVKILSP